jgi:mannose-6-phosphate isomerase-like protein (cupin superfamily)
VRGEAAQVDVAAIPLTAILSFVYLVVFGSLIAFTAYIWLLGVTTPARVATYAFVNPVVAVVLGCAVLGEPFNPQFIVAAAIIVVAVTLVITSRTRVQPAVEAGPGDARSAPPLERRDAARFNEGRQFSFAEIKRLRKASERPYHEFLRTEAMSGGLYCLPAGGFDAQRPHEEDEVYLLLEGAADFRMGDRVTPVQAGDVLYVPARLPHRFEQIRESLTMLVLFAPAETIDVEAGEPEVAECC